MARHNFDARSDFVTRPIPSQGIQTLIDQAAQPGAGAILFDCYGGAINRVAPHATAFVHRNALFCIQYYTEGSSAWLNSAHAAMRPYVSGQAYQNYIDPRLKHWQHAYYGANYPRLVAVQQRVDPHHKFDFPQAIGS